MEMNGEQRIPASKERVWAALNDVEVLRRCIPGCETLEKLSDSRMRATAKVKVGPIAARFAGDVTLSDIDPPNGYRIAGEGQGGVAGFARGGAVVRLEADGDETILHYTVDAQVGGKLAQLGSRLVDATARQMAGAFFAQFAATLRPQQPEGSGAAPGAPSPPHPSAILPASRGPAWMAPVFAIVALSVLAWIFLRDAGSQAAAMPRVDGLGAVVLALVALAAAVGYLFGERAR
ncbi:MAG TPA: carbon monoxide dehydrogenase subunit G [Novosphingobium sp.]|nr:carbon monoxide dehydrogenase subunit G [Novosphingobium sp.]